MRSSAALLWSRARWRRHLTALTMSAVVLALTGSFALGAAGSALRAASAMDRLRSETSAADIALGSIDERSDPEMPMLLERLAPLIGIDGLTSQTTYFIQPVGVDVAVIVDFVAIAQHQLTDAPANVPKLLRGRVPDPLAPDEIAVSERLAERLGLSPGDRMVLESASQGWIDTMFAGGETGAPDGPRLDMLVTGVVVAPIDFSMAFGAIFLSPAFGPVYDEEIGHYVTFQARLHDPAVVDDLLAAGVGGADDPELAAAIFSDPSEWRDRAQVADGLRVVATGLWLFAGVVALAGLAVFAVLARRLGRSVGAEVGTLSAVGLDRRGTVGFGLALFAPPIICGLAAGVFAAPLISTRLRLGLAASVEPDRGVHVDGRLLAIGGAGLALVAVAVAVPSLLARPSTSRRAGATARVRLRRPVVVALGVREALAGTTLQASSRATIAASSAMMVAAVASVVFGASLGGLDSTPHAWGNPADVTVDFGEREGGEPNEPYRAGLETLADDDRVHAVTGMTLFEPVIGGANHMAVVLDVRKGAPILTVLSGRPPAAPDEIALGEVTMEALRLGLGDEVELTVAESAASFRLVGQVAFPDGDLDFDDGAAITADGGDRFPSLGGFLVFQAALTWADGVDAGPATDDLEGRGFDVFANRQPSVVDNLGQVGRLPTVLAGFFVLLVIATLGYSMTVAARAAGRQVAILSALGLPARRGRVVLAYQSLTLAVVTVVIGIPAGIVTGRLAWSAVADRAGFAVSHGNPAVAVAGTGLLASAGALAVGAVLMSGVGRRPPHVALRAD